MRQRAIFGNLSSESGLPDDFTVVGLFLFFAGEIVVAFEI
jgi:hypothetical protein